MTDQNTPNPEPTTGKTPLQQFIDHQNRAAQETVKALQALVPPEFREHSKNARTEFLNSFKVLIEGAQDAINHEMEKAKAAPQDSQAKHDEKGASGPSTTGKSKVKVEVS